MTAFEEMAVAYDNTIPWKTRLNREIPFLLKVLQETEKGRILDLACGSGRHAVALAKHGFFVTGIDTSPAMIKEASRHAKVENVIVKFLVGDMGDVEKIVKRSFDLILCLGNSLSLLPGIKELQQTLKAGHSLLSENGVFVAQILNFVEIRNTKFRFFPIREGHLNTSEEIIFTRFFEPIVNTKTATLVLSAFIKKREGWVPKITTQKILQLDNTIIDKLLRTSGFSKWVFYSDFEQTSFQPKTHRNLVFMARR